MKKQIQKISVLLGLLSFLFVGYAQAQFDVSIDVQEPSCNGYSDGIATATAEGGVSPYTYQWSHGAISSSIENMPANFYNLDIIDSLGCTASSEVKIGQPEKINISFHTVQTYRKRLLEKTGVKNTSELINFSMLHSLL